MDELHKYYLYYTVANLGLTTTRQKKTLTVSIESVTVAKSELLGVMVRALI